MKVLFVCSGNSMFGVSPFVKEQGDSLRNQGIDVDYFLIKGNGIIGYLKNYPYLKRKIRLNKYNLIHAHYGLSGMLCVLQRKVPVIITFHGSDINNSYHRKFSKIAILLSAYNIFVHKSIRDKINAKNKNSIIPCGVNLNTFHLSNMMEARKEIHLDLKKKYVLFAGSFDNRIKNSKLAIESVKNISDTELIELKGYNRNQVSLLMNACDVILITSFSEGSPQVIKEAMACNLPIVSTDVGDVKEVIGNTEGCYITSFDPKDVAEKIGMALDFGKRTNGRENIKHLEINIIAKRIIKLYNKVLA